MILESPLILQLRIPPSQNSLRHLLPKWQTASLLPLPILHLHSFFPKVSHSYTRPNKSISWEQLSPVCPLCISALSDIISDQISWVVKVPYTVLNGTNVPLFGTNFLCLQACGYCVEVDKVLGVVVLGVGVSLCGHVSLVQGQFHQKLMWLLFL